VKYATFLRRHILWIGFFAVLVPLVVNARLQYESLAKLEATAPAARKASLSEKLTEVASEAQQVCEARAREALDVPLAELVRGDASPITRHFLTGEPSWAKRSFVVYLPRDRFAQVLFYDRASQSLQSEPESQDWVAAHAASSPWMVLALKGATSDGSRITVDERDPSNRIVLKPVVDDASRVIGVAGMIVDTKSLEQFLVDEVRALVPKHFTDSELSDVILTIRDAGNRVAFASREGESRADEVSVAFPFVLKDWRLGVQRRGMTLEEAARYLFVVNVAMSLLMTVSVLGGIAVALRAASREIRLSKMKADFVSNVSHELRTPLSSIRVFAEFLKMGRVDDPAKVREYGEYIEAESRRLSQLIANILDFSRIESGQKTYTFERADVVSVVASTIKSFEMRLCEQEFAISLSAPAVPPPPAVIDADAISLAVANLLDNAVKYSGTAREVSVRIEHVERFLSVSVVDGGIGIPRDEHEKIFERFHRVGNALVHDVKGSGLGLAIVKHIVSAHRGWVTVDSEPGRGSRFTIFLPVSDRVEAAPGRRRAQADATVA
jgi:signal transduction histidine kinase